MSILKLLLLVAVVCTSRTLTPRCFGIRHCCRLRGVEQTPSLAAGEGDAPAYFYEYNTTVTVTTAATTSLQTRYWIWVWLDRNLSTSTEKSFKVAILNNTDYQGSEEQGFNNTEEKHQPIFQINIDANTSLPTTIRISDQLAINYLGIAEQILDHIAPNLNVSEDSTRLLFSLSESLVVGDGSGTPTTDVEKLIVLNLEQPVEDGNNGNGVRRISLADDGTVRDSNLSYSVNFGGQAYLDGKGQELGASTPVGSVEMNQTFVLASKQNVDAAFLKLFN